MNTGKPITPGKWTVSTRQKLGVVKYLLELLPDGNASCTAKWTLVRIRMTGKWRFDAQTQALELYLTRKGEGHVESMIVRAIDWQDEYSANCELEGEGRKCQSHLTRGFD